MPMKALVTNVGGRAIAETRGGTRRLMQHDAMGNVISLINDAGVVTDTYEYWSYGEIRTQTGTSVNPWKFGGAWGYYTDASGRQYVRARTLRNDLGRWITVDPLWPRQRAYRYAKNSPMSYGDASGLAADLIGCDGPKKNTLSDCCSRVSPGSLDRDKVKECMARSGFGFVGYPGDVVDWFLNIIQHFCSGSGGKNSVCVRCEGPNGIPQWPKECPNPCEPNVWGATFSTGSPFPIPKGLPDKCGLEPYPEECAGAHTGTGGSKCPCSIVMCDAAFGTPLQSPCAIFYHELSHCSKLGHIGGESPPPNIKVPRELDFIYKLGCCVCKATHGEDKCGEECARIK